jgi:hypothetical protein
VSTDAVMRAQTARRPTLRCSVACHAQSGWWAFNHLNDAYRFLALTARTILLTASSQTSSITCLR